MSFTPKQSASIVLAAAVLLAGATWSASRDNGPGTERPVNAAGTDNAEDGRRSVVAGLGVVEPASGMIELSALMPGVISVITKAEGDPVQRGEILAELVNEDLKALVAQAESTVRIEAARLALIENGPRPEEIAQGEARVREEQSNLKLFEAQSRRRQALVQQGAVARETLDEVQRALAASEQRLDLAMRQLDILRQGSRREELEAARASYKLTEDKLAEARAMLNKSFVRSTIDGVVLRRYLQPGEALSTEPAIAIMQIADTSQLVVRTQIDENDIAGLKVGQQAEISAPALRGKTLHGTVSRISPRLGAKTVTAEAPDEKRDTRVLDVIVALDRGTPVPVNLRVDVVIDLGSGAAPETKPAEPSTLRGALEAPHQVATSAEHCRAIRCSAAEGVDLLATGSLRP